MNTINVIEIPNVDKMVPIVRSFSDDKDGRKKAEKLFRELVCKNFANRPVGSFHLTVVLDNLVEAGHFDDNAGYWVGIVPSVGFVLYVVDHYILWNDRTWGVKRMQIEIPVNLNSLEEKQSYVKEKFWNFYKDYPQFEDVGPLYWMGPKEE